MFKHSNHHSGRSHHHHHKHDSTSLWPHRKNEGHHHHHHHHNSFARGERALGVGAGLLSIGAAVGGVVSTIREANKEIAESNREVEKAKQRLAQTEKQCELSIAEAKRQSELRIAELKRQSEEAKRQSASRPSITESLEKLKQTEIKCNRQIEEAFRNFHAQSPKAAQTLAEVEIQSEKILAKFKTENEERLAELDKKCRLNLISFQEKEDTRTQDPISSTLEQPATVVMPCFEDQSIEEIKEITVIKADEQPLNNIEPEAEVLKLDIPESTDAAVVDKKKIESRELSAGAVSIIDAKATFLSAHKSIFKNQASSCWFGLFRKTKIHEKMGLKEIVSHAMQANNRSRQAMMTLNWMTPDGKISKDAPLEIQACKI